MKIYLLAVAFGLVWLRAGWFAPGAAVAHASAAPTGRSPRPQLAVRGLAGSYRLKMRLTPGPTGRTVGEIPAGVAGVIATGKRRQVGRALWHEVEFQGVRGWVHGRFVGRVAAAPAPAPAPAAVFDQDLVCLGSAPSWKLIVDRDGSSAGSAAFGPGALSEAHAVAAEPLKGVPRTWSMTLQDAQGVGVVTMVLHETWRCRLSNRSPTYTYEVTTHQPSGTVLRGCCNSLRRTSRR